MDGDNVQSGGESPDQGGLYAEALSSVPEELRSHVEPHFKQWDRNVQSKFSEAAEYRKKWEPFEELGLTDRDPQTVKELLNLHDMWQDQDSLVAWHQELGEALRENGLLDDGEGGEGEDDFEDPRIAELEKQIQTLMNDHQQTQQQQQYEEAAKHVQTELEKIKSDSFPDMTPEDADTICAFALKYDGPEAVQKGYADFQAFMGRAEKNLFAKKKDAPAQAESGGAQVAQSKPVTNFGDARQAALTRLREGGI